MNIIPYKKKDGTTCYKFQIRLGHKVTTRSGFFTKHDAIVAYTKMVENKEEYLRGNLTFTNVFESFLEIYSTKVKEATLRNALSIFYLHILPVFGNKKIHEIKVIECQNFAMTMSKFVRGKMFFNYAKRVMDFAYKMDLVKSNPFEKVIHPNYKKKKKQLNYLEVEQANKLLDYFKDDLYWYTMFRLFIYSGLRRGELLALEWSDINFNKKTIRVEKTLTIGLYNKVILNSTKTESSNRVINIDGLTLHFLKKLKLKTKNKLVFPSAKGTYQRLSNPQDRLDKACKHLELDKIRVHDLRHTHASLLFASGSNAKEVQERLGHSDIQTTMNIYTHVTKDKKEKSLNDFINYMEKVKSS